MSNSKRPRRAVRPFYLSDDPTDNISNLRSYLGQIRLFLRG
ncbi:hypothetical protein YQE_05310, partial [Dendroctonus ponderosae]